MVKEFGTFCEQVGCQNLLNVRFFDPHGRTKFKNPYAGLIWAASRKSLFGSPLDLAWIFAFFRKS